MHSMVCLAILALHLSSPPSPFAEPDDRWIEVTGPHFIVVSNAGEELAGSVAREFEQYRAVLRSALPPLRQDPLVPPIILAVRDEASLKALLPKYWTKEGNARPAGVFQPGIEKNYIALRLDARGAQRHRVIYHEYVHLLASLNLPPLPIWLNEGLAEFFGQAMITETITRLGHPSLGQLSLLRREQLIPVKELFAVDYASPYYNDATLTPLFYAESWALTHYLLIGEKGDHSDKLWRYAELLRRGVTEPEARSRTLGKTEALQQRLELYVRELDYLSIELPTPTSLEPAAFPVRNLNQSSVLAIQGDFLVHTECWDEAAEKLREAARLDPHNPSPHESLGLMLELQGKAMIAADHFRTAMSLGSKSSLAYYHAGLAASRSGRPESPRQAEEYLRKAVQLNPHFAPGYAALSKVLADQDGRGREALETAERAIELAPGVLGHYLNFAYILLRSERVDDAIEVGERVLSSARTAEDHRAAESFLISARAYQQQLRSYQRRVRNRAPRGHD